MNSIVLCGFMGCGKSTVGALLAERLGYRFIDTDSYIEQQVGQTVRDIFAEVGENGFRDIEHRCCKQLSGCARTVIATGGGALTFERNVKLFSNDTVIFLDIPYEECFRRIGSDPARPLLSGDTRELYEKRRPLYTAAADYIIGNLDLTQTVGEIIKIIGEVK